MCCILCVFLLPAFLPSALDFDNAHDNLTHGLGKAPPSFLSSRSKQGSGNVMPVCMSLCMCKRVQVPAKARRGCWIP